MRYDDASQAGSMANDSAPMAHADVDAIPPGGYGASGNAITGAGTISGAAGADSVADGPARVVEVHGSGGATSQSGSGFQALGQYGVLTMDAQGNFNYARNANTPDGVQDVFGYTIADSKGATSSTTLTMGVGPAGPGDAAAAAAAAAGVVNLPPGVEMSDIHVNGRDLVINMPDGTQMVIPGGAVFVPQLVIGDVEVPANNLAALLVDSEPTPAASPLQSSGGNFANPVPPLDPGVPLGDLIPPTELTYVPPEFHEVNQFEDDEPEIVIIPDGQPAAVNAVDSVDEAGLPARTGEPEGSGEELAAGANGDPSEATSGVISIDSRDGIDSVTINGVVVTGVAGQQIPGEQGVLTITSVNFSTGQIAYTYVLTDNTDPGGDNISDVFSVTITDNDGDTASASLTIDIIDDTPIARDDTDAVTLNSPSTDGNVMTGEGTTSGAAGKDTVGADDATLTGIHAGTGGSFTSVPQNGSGVLVHGAFGDLVIHDDGTYTYTRTSNSGGTDVFTYQLTDGDGDTETATLTIAVPIIDRPVEITDLTPAVNGGDAIVNEDDLQDGSDTSKESTTATGDFKISAPDGVDDLKVGGFDVIVNGVFQAGSHTTPLGNTLTFISYNSATGVITYSYTLNDNESHPNANGENSIFEDFTVTLTDTDGDSDTDTLSIQIVDDVPAIDVTGATTVTEGETATGTWSQVVGADNPGTTVVVFNGNTFALGSNIDTGKGILVVNADGTWSFTAANNLDNDVTQSISFSVRVTDSDQDVAIDSQTVTIEDGAGPSAPRSPADLLVDDEALSDGTNPSSTAEVDSDTLQFGAGSDDLVDFQFSNSLAGLGGGLTWTRVSGTEIQGWDGPVGSGTLVVTLTLNAPSSIAAGDTGTVTVTATLNNNYDGHPTFTADDVANLGSVTVIASDQDGDSAAGIVNVAVSDDVPEVDVLGPTSVVEGQTVNGTWNSDMGADNPGSTVVVFNGNTYALGSNIDTGKGTLVVNADGTWSFTASGNLDQDVAQSITFSVQLTDTDNDVALDSQTITINDGPGPQGGDSVSLLVDDEALSDGTNPGSTAEVDSDTLSFTAGSDDLTGFAFSNNLASLGGGLTWTRVSDTQIQGWDGAVGSGTLVVTLTLNAPSSIAAGGTGDVTVTATLNNNYDSHPTFTADDLQALGSVQVVATDQDGDTATGTVNVSVSDDIPEVDVLGPTSVVEGQSINGTWSGDMGADNPGSTVVVFNGNTYALGSNIDTGKGTLVVNANGTWSFTASSGLDNSVLQQVTFSVRLTDTDNDVALDSQTITINDGAGPTGGGSVTLVVDDEALSDGTNPSSTAEVDTDTLSFTAGSDAITSFAFSNNLASLGGGLTWTRVSDTEIQGWDGPVGTGTKVVTLTLNAPGSIAAGATGNVTVTATLNNNYDSHPTFTADDLQALGSVQVVASDGDDTATGTVNLSVSDDIPEVDVLGPTTVVEGQSINGTWTGAMGADNPGSTVVVFNGNTFALGSNIATGKGTLVVNANGTWSFTANNNLDQDVAQSITFSVRLTDTDNDVALDSQTISITDGAGPTGGGSITLEVDDEALANGGTNAASTAEVDSDTLSFTAGSDALTTFAFGSSLASLGGGLTWTRVSDTEIQGWDGPVGTGTKVITLTLNAPGSIAAGATGNVTVTATLNDNYDSHPGINVDDLQNLGSVTVVASDQDGDSATGTVNVGVSDDTPLNFSPVDLTDTDGSTATPQDNALVNDGTANVTRLINDANNDGVGENFIGADGFGSLVFTAAGHTNGEALKDINGVALTSHGDAILLSGFGTSTLTAYVESGANAGFQVGQDTVVFTASLNTGTGFGSTSTYTIDFDDIIDDGSGITISDFSTAPAGQNDWIGLDSDGNGINVDNNDSPDLLLTPTNAGGSVNTSATDIGNSNQWIDNGEGIRIDFVQDVRYGSGDEKDVAGYTFDSHYAVHGTSFSIMQTQGGGDAAVRIAAYNDADTGTLTDLTGAIVPIDQSSIVVTGDTTFTIVAMGDGTFVITGLNAGANVSFNTVGGADYDAIAITSAAGVLNPATPSPSDTFSGAPFAIGNFGYFTEAAGNDLDLSLGVTATDGDGDTSTGTIDLTLVPNGSSTLSALSSFSANDNLRTASTNTMIMSAALAAAGLDSAAAAAPSDHGGKLSSHDNVSHFEARSGQVHDTKVDTNGSARESLLVGSRHASDDPRDSSDGRGSHSGEQQSDHSVSDANGASPAAVSELAEGEASASNEAATPSIFTSQAIMMPGAQMLAAAGKGEGHGKGVDAQAASVEGNAQHNEVVGKVLADALHGGGHHGPDLDALVDAVSGKDGGHHATKGLEALASHGASSVPNGDMAVFAAFTGHGMHAMDPMTMHQDAAPSNG